MTSKHSVQIAPSLLAADWGRLHAEVQAVELAGADLLHLDVMDGHFVPPITFGPEFVKAARKASKLSLDVHLMIDTPEKHIQAFADAGANNITVHAEACPHLHRVIQQIHDLKLTAGVAINPATSLSAVEEILPSVDLLLLMTVNPGWGGQVFIDTSEKKISQAYSMIKKTGRSIRLQVDGGINEQTAKIATSAGADVLVAGTYIFKHKAGYQTAIQSLR